MHTRKNLAAFGLRSDVAVRAEKALTILDVGEAAAVFFVAQEDDNQLRFFAQELAKVVFAAGGTIRCGIEKDLHGIEATLHRSAEGADVLQRVNEALPDLVVAGVLVDEVLAGDDLQWRARRTVGLQATALGTKAPVVDAVESAALSEVFAGIPWPAKFIGLLPGDAVVAEADVRGDDADAKVVFESREHLDEAAVSQAVGCGCGEHVGRGIDEATDRQVWFIFAPSKVLQVVFADGTRRGVVDERSGEASLFLLHGTGVVDDDQDVGGFFIRDVDVAGDGQIASRLDLLEHPTVTADVGDGQRGQSDEGGENTTHTTSEACCRRTIADVSSDDDGLVPRFRR